MANYRAALKNVVLGPAPTQAALRRKGSVSRMNGLGRSPSRLARLSGNKSLDSSRASSPISSSGSVEGMRVGKPQGRPPLVGGKPGAEKPPRIAEALTEGTEKRETTDAEAKSGGGGAAAGEGSVGGGSADGSSGGGNGASAVAGDATGGEAAKPGTDSKSTGKKPPLQKGNTVTFDRQAASAAAGAKPPPGGEGGSASGERSILDDIAQAELLRFHTITALDMELVQGILKELREAGQENGGMGALAAMAQRAAQAASRAADSATAGHAELEEYQSTKATVPHDLEELQKIPPMKLLQNLSKQTAEALIQRGIPGMPKSVGGPAKPTLSVLRAEVSAVRERSRSRSKSPRRNKGSRSPSPSAVKSSPPPAAAAAPS